MSQHDRYISPFETRYASKEMQYIFSEDNKFRTWRRLWIALAKAEKEQGLPITDEQIAELEAHKDDINYEDAQRRERECRHDVMSHVFRPPNDGSVAQSVEQRTENPRVGGSIPPGTTI